MSFNFYAYLAGLVDSEGCLTVTKKPVYPRDKSNGRCNYRPTLTIGMTDREPLELITKYWPKTIYVVPHPPNKTMYVVRYQTNLTKEILEKIYPFLRVKREQADVLLELINLKDSYTSTGISNKNQHILLREKITQLKKRNVFDYPNQPVVPTFINIHDEYSYLAGLIDGDGHIGHSIAQVKRPDRNNKIYTRHWCCIRVVMNQPEGIIALARLFNGQIKKDTFHNHKCFSVQLTGENLQKALEALIPHLQLKRNQAEELLKFVNTQRRHIRQPNLSTNVWK